VLPYVVIEVREYVDGSGRSPYGVWFDSLNAEAAARVAIALTRISLGNLSNVRSIGSGVSECRLNFGPGYRIYFGRDGEELLILLGGGAKKRQQRDIRAAIDRWEDYKRRKKESRGIDKRF
jgi:putative addiction module killer protein